MTHTLKNSSGDITGKQPDESWSPFSVSEVIADIESRVHSVVFSEEGDTRVHVIDGPHGKYLRTHGDQEVFNNLDELRIGTGSIPRVMG